MRRGDSFLRWGCDNIDLMPKKKTPKSAKRIKHSKKKHIGYGVITGTILVAVFILYLGFNNIKTNSITSFEECASAGNPVMESYPRQCRAHGKTFVESLSNDSTSHIMQVDKSENGKYIHVERGNYIINSLNEWNEMFGQMGVRPDVNFNEKTVIAVFMGQKPTGGYSVSLRQLEVTKDKVQFLVEESVPSKNCIVTQVITNPYQIIAIDKTEKEISFIGNTITKDCSE